LGDSDEDLDLDDEIDDDSEEETHLGKRKPQHHQSEGEAAKKHQKGDAGIPHVKAHLQ